MLVQLYDLFLTSSGVVTDTRNIKPNSIFFALKGERFNGNEFAKAALDAGATYAVIDEEKYAIDNRCFLVDDVLTTLQNLAAHHRQQFNIPFIAITGSNGKTTTKELIHAVLSSQFNCMATVGNLNNHIGVPLTLLQINKDTEIAIIEMGANHLKEIEAYCKWVKPTHGLITNIGNAHLEGFGSYENIIKAKSELYEALKAQQKIIFYNDDDYLLKSLLTDYDYKISYGTSNDLDTVVQTEQLFPTLSVRYENEVLTSNLFGEYNFPNIMAAIALASYFDISIANIKLSLKQYTPKNNRSEIRTLGTNLVILDAYNANPTSVQAAVKSFAQLNVVNKVVIIGDMFELGKDSQKLHQDIVSYIESYSFDYIVFVGAEFLMCKSKQNSLFLANTDDAKKWFELLGFENHTILIKGSRGMKMESLLS